MNSTPPRLDEKQAVEPRCPDHLGEPDHCLICLACAWERERTRTREGVLSVARDCLANARGTTGKESTEWADTGNQLLAILDGDKYTDDVLKHPWPLEVLESGLKAMGVST